jgi:hypothetical protein
LFGVTALNKLNSKNCKLSTKQNNNKQQTQNIELK